MSDITTVQDRTDWHTESLRFTAFFDPTVEHDWSEWWVQAVGEVPESRVEKPRDGTLREEGQFLWGRLALVVEPGRVDWILAGAVSAILDKGTFDSLPKLDNAAPDFVALLKRWLGSAQKPTTRIALGTVLLLPVEDRECGYRRIAHYLPRLEIDPTGSADLFYQINRPRTSTTLPSLRINRLSKWAVSALQSARLHIVQAPASERTAASATQVLGPPLSACRLELDINTEAENVKPLPAELVDQVLDELLMLSYEIANRGDVP